MDLQIVTLRLDPATGAFPERPLSGIEGEVLSVAEHFFFHEAWPHLLIIAQIRASRAGTAAVSRPGRSDPRAGLTAEERERYDRVRVWRKARAEAEAVPAFAILNNRQLADLVKACPTTLAGLRRIRGIGEAKAAAWGEDVLVVLASGTPVGGSDG